MRKASSRDPAAIAHPMNTTRVTLREVWRAGGLLVFIRLRVARPADAALGGVSLGHRYYFDSTIAR